MSEAPRDPQLVEKLDSMDIANLRKTAKLYNIPLSRDMTAEDIRNAIHRKREKQNFVLEADTSKRPGPGRWRIILHKTSENGVKAGSRPVSLRVQGYFCTIPRNVPVDVPEKVVRVLENSFHYDMVENETGDMAMEARLTYPFQIVDFTDGPDPYPGYEKAKARKYKRREAFRDEFGYWPKNMAQVEEAEERGLIGPKKPPAIQADN